MQHSQLSYLPIKTYQNIYWISFQILNIKNKNTAQTKEEVQPPPPGDRLFAGVTQMVRCPWFDSGRRQKRKHEQHREHYPCRSHPRLLVHTVPPLCTFGWSKKLTNGLHLTYCCPRASDVPCAAETSGKYRIWMQTLSQKSGAGQTLLQIVKQRPPPVFASRRYVLGKLQPQFPCMGIT